MRNKISNTLIGLIFIAFGFAFLGHALDWWGSIFFDGWWTLFIIIPCVISMISTGIQVGNVIGVGVGLILLLSAQDVLDYSTAWKVMVPVVLLLVGFAIIFRSFRPHKSITDPNSRIPKSENATAIFGGAEPNFIGQEFKGLNSSAIFGGVDLILKSSVINEDCEINCTAIFGGIDIVLPSNVKCKLINTSILGGVDNKFVSSTDPNAPVVTINATCIFGGLEIK